MNKDSLRITVQIGEPDPDEGHEHCRYKQDFVHSAHECSNVAEHLLDMFDTTNNHTTSRTCQEHLLPAIGKLV